MYHTVCRFFDVKLQDSAINDTLWVEIDKLLSSTKKILETMKSVDDLIIMLHLYSSYSCLKTRRLISAENFLKDASRRYRNKKKINVEDRPDIPVIPSCILLQRIFLQRGLIKKEYGKYIHACLIFTVMLKVGKIFDPLCRMEALTQLESIFTDPKASQVFKTKPDIRNIRLMLEFFKRDKFKNTVLLVDSHKDTDQICKLKSDVLLEIFKNLTDEDFLSMITISRKVKVVFSISKKSKNTTQLSNQLSNIIWDETPR